jgi:predicted RNA-binding protein YlxR (DUF448 family)
LAEKKVPLRTCIGCGQCRTKKELVRIVRRPDGSVVLDRTGREAGRGAYLCDDPACFEKAVRKKSLSRALGVPIPEELLNELRSSGAGNEAKADPGGGCHAG